MWRFFAASAVALSTGCYSGLSVDVGPGGIDTAAGSATAGDGSGDDGDPDGPDSGDPQLGCDGGPRVVGRTPLRRLSQAEYNATVADLLGDASALADGFVADEERGGFPNNATAADALQIDQYRAAASTLAETAAQTQFEAWIDCDRESETCAGTFIEWFGARAFRRPLESSEREEYLALYRDLHEDTDGTTALQHVVEAMLMSPYFLYHVELGEPGATGDMVALTSWEVAGRLSYFLWGTMPDASLMTAAADGRLDSLEGIEAEARRLLEDPRAKQSLARFARHWLELGSLAEAERDADAFPDWSPSLLGAMQAEADAFVAETWIEDGDFRSLFMGVDAQIDDPALAELYGVTLADDDAGPVMLDPSERAGVLTLGAVLVSHAYPTENSWVHRGKLVRTSFLCGEMPPPPDFVEFEDVNDPNRLTNPECSGCHLLMDPIGQAFDAYDPTGRYVGPPLVGEVAASEIGAFDSIADLGAKMAEDQAVQACLATQVGRFALARTLDGQDACSRDWILERFAESDYDLRELMVAIVTSDAFVMLNKGEQG